MVSCGSKNGHQKDMCLKEVGICTQNDLTILGSIISINGVVGGYFVILMAPVLLALKNHSSNMGAWKIVYIVARSSYDIRGPKKYPTFVIQVENLGKYRNLTI